MLTSKNMQEKDQERLTRGNIYMGELRDRYFDRLGLHNEAGIVHQSEPPINQVVKGILRRARHQPK